MLSPPTAEAKQPAPGPGPSVESDREPQRRPPAQRAPRPSQLLAPPPPPHLPPSVQNVLRSPGRPLPSGVRREVEAHFRTELGDVRVHSDAAAAGSARAINAEAYTFGGDIVFGPSRFAPGTPSGDVLLRHEIAHVLQQRGATRAEPGLSAPSRLEQQAASASSRPAAVGPALTSGGVARVARQTSRSDLMTLSDEQLEAEQTALEAWLQQHAASDAEYNSNVAYLTSIQSVLGQRHPARARRAERVKVERTILKGAGAVVVLGGPVLGTLGIGPIVATFLTEFGAGVIEGIDEQPPERKQRLLERFDNLYYTWGNWGDKIDYYLGYLKGIPLGVWGEIKGIWDFIVLLAEVNQKFNDWLLSTAFRLLGGDTQAFIEKGRAAYQRLQEALTKVEDELTALLKDPATTLVKLNETLDSLLEGALTKANELGHDAVDKAFSFLEEPYGQLGEDIGKVTGAVIFNVVLLVATDAIGNLIKEGVALAARIGRTVLEGVVEFARGAASFFGRAWELLRGVGRRLFSGETMELIAKAIGEFLDWLAELVKLPEMTPLPVEGPAVDLGELGKGSRLESRAVERPPGGPKVEDLYPPREARPPEPGPRKRPSRFTTEQIEEELNAVREEGLIEGPGESALIEAEPWEPPEGAPPKPDLDTPPEVRREWLQDRLQMHVDQAVERYLTEGLTDAQEAAVRRDPRALARFRGARIDGFAKSTVLSDPELAEVLTSSDYFREPDFMDSILPDWFDVTTRESWQRHLLSYADTFGSQAGLLPTMGR